jgi:hypothetical protein
MLKFIFNHNFFYYADTLFRQTDGIAMGTNVAPIIANLYLAIKFDSLIDTIPSISKFGRFIDDCIMLVDSTIDFESKVLPQLKHFASPINITFEKGINSIDFLDLTIFRANDNIAFKIFQKPLNNYNYIPMMSHHPVSTLRGFITGELTRYKRYCTFQEDFQSIADLFFNRLLARGYPPRFVQRVYSDFAQSKIPTEEPTLNSSSKDIFSLVIRHSHQHDVHNHLRDRLRSIFDTLSPDRAIDFRLAFKSNPNLCQLAMRSALSSNQITYLKSVMDV